MLLQVRQLELQQDVSNHNSLKEQQQEQQGAFSVSTIGSRYRCTPRSPSHASITSCAVNCTCCGICRSPVIDNEQPSGDQIQTEAPAAFGDYHYQDEVGGLQEHILQSAMQSFPAAEDHETLVTGDAEGHRQAYLIEDPAGGVSIVEEKTRNLPDGGQVVWQRTTGPDGGAFCFSVAVTCLAMIPQSAELTPDTVNTSCIMRANMFRLCSLRPCAASCAAPLNDVHLPLSSCTKH